MAESLYAWLGLSLVYMLYALYVQLRYHDILPRTIPAAIFVFGAAIFIALNRWWWFPDTVSLDWLEYVVMALLAFALLLASFAVRWVVQRVRQFEIDYGAA